MPVQTNEGGTVITGNSIRVFQMNVQLRALGLELRGMTRRGQSAYSIIKQTYGLKGNKQKVYDQFAEIVRAAMEQDMMEGAA